jgi:hypothetical protein
MKSSQADTLKNLQNPLQDTIAKKDEKINTFISSTSTTSNSRKKTVSQSRKNRPSKVIKSKPVEHR